MKGRRLSKMSRAILPSVLAALAGFLLGFLIMLFVNPQQALQGIGIILMGGFQKGAVGIGQTLYYATPIIMTGLAVGFAFKTGLFNIGASGQFMLGSFAAVYVGVTMTWLPGSIHWLVALLAAMLAGALWGLMPGLLKAVSNVSEVITSIMMNYIGMSLVNLLIKATVYNKLKNETMPVAATANIPKWGLNQLFPYNSMNGGILIAVVCAIVIYIVLNKTTFGYELKACGFNKNASLYAGINAKRNIIFSMMISGALAGIGGGLLYLAGSGKYIKVIDIIASEGFNGMSVALLGLSNPIGILIAGLFIAYIQVGGFNLQLLNYDQEIINIITAAIIYFSGFVIVFQSNVEYLQNWWIGRNSKKTDGPPKAEAQETSSETIEHQSPMEGGGQR